MAEYRKWFSHQKEKTRNTNALKLKAYCDWIRKTPEQLIEEYQTARKDVQTLQDWKRETKNKITEFYNYLKTEGYQINTARSTPLGILRFYHSHCEQIEDATKEFDAVQIPENEFVFTQEHLRKMFYYADTEEKAILSLAVSLGYSSIDFLELECEKLKQLVTQAKTEHLDFIMFIGKTRQKTSVQPRSFLTPESIESVSEYLSLLSKKYGKLSKYLLANGEPDTHITNQGLNKKIQRLVSKANIETYGKQVKFHCVGRKFLYSQLQQINRDIAKVICAKKVDASIITYIPDLDAECNRVFRECYKKIALNGDLSGKTKQEQTKRVEELENALLSLSKDAQAQKTVNELLTKRIEDLTNIIYGIKAINPELVEATKRKIGLENIKLKTKSTIEALGEIGKKERERTQEQNEQREAH